MESKRQQKFSRVIQKELSEIFQREGLSFDFELCLDAGLAEISRNPDSFQKKHKEIRILFISRFPYGIHYVVRNSEIIVIAVFHTSRSPKNWKNRI